MRQASLDGGGTAPPPPAGRPLSWLTRPSNPPPPPRPAPPRAPGSRELISTWGLWALLAALPVIYGIKDLSDGEGLSRLGQNILEGLSNGSIWALIALGYTLVYGIIELINFAHGDVFMIGSFVAAGIFGTIGLTLTTGPLGLVGGLLVVLIICMVACGSLNVMIERVGLPAAAQRAQARAADHRGRLLLHPAERRPAVARRLAGRACRTSSAPSRTSSRSSASRSSAPTCSRSA